MPRQEPKESVGSKALKAALTPKLTQEQLAERLGVTQQAVSSWAQGRTVPSPKYMAEIEDALGIRMRDWTLDPDVAEADPPAATGTEHG